MLDYHSFLKKRKEKKKKRKEKKHNYHRGITIYMDCNSRPILDWNRHMDILPLISYFWG